MNKLICWLFGHSYKFNFASMPDKTICKNCKRKWYWNGKIGEGYKWIETDKFTFTPGCERTDEELIKQWVN